MSVRDWLKFILLGGIWGSSFLWIKIALVEISPQVLVTYRVTFALLGLVIYAAVKHTRLPRPFPWVAFLILGLTNLALPFLLISWSEQYISSGLAAILNSTTPLFTILFAPMFLADERWSAARAAGMLLGFLGVVVLMSNEFATGISATAAGVAGMLLASLSYGASAIYVRRKIHAMAPEMQGAGQMLFAVTIMLGVLAVSGEHMQLPRLALTWEGVLWLGLMGSCVGSLLYFSLINSVGPTRTTLVSYIFPLVGVLLGIIFLQEKLDWRLAAGGGMIVAGVVLVTTPSPGFLHLRKLAPDTARVEIGEEKI